MLASCGGSKSNRFLAVVMGAEPRSLTGVCRCTLSAQNRELLAKAPRWCGMRVCSTSVPCAQRGLWSAKQSLPSHPQGALSQPCSQCELA